MKKILSIEDSIDDIEFIKLSHNEYSDISEIIFVRNIEELNGKISHEIFDLILLDINLPRVNGFEILSKIKASKNNHTPVVLFTTSNWQGDIQKAYELGANSFVSKPFKLKDFNEMIGCIFEYWLKINCVKSYDE